MPEIEDKDKGEPLTPLTPPVEAIAHVNPLNEQPPSPEAAKPGRLESGLAKLRRMLHTALTPNNPSWRIPRGASFGPDVKIDSLPPTLRTGNAKIDYSRALAQEKGIPAERIIRHSDGFPADEAWAASFREEKARK